MTPSQMRSLAILLVFAVSGSIVNVAMGLDTNSTADIQTALSNSTVLNGGGGLAIQHQVMM